LDHYTLTTDRLLLTPVAITDAERLAAFHADARVMSLLKHGVLSRSESDRLVADYAAGWRALGFGTWIATELASGMFVGLGGLWVHDAGHGIALRAAFTPAAQGKGHGPELGRAAIAFAFNLVKLDRVVAITRLENIAGQRSLEKFGMIRQRELAGENGGTIFLYAAVNPNKVDSRPGTVSSSPAPEPRSAGGSGG
jgi:RimJ/RimL family protein N-acetyltransferase